MSFLIDAPWLYANGRAYAALRARARAGRAARRRDGRRVLGGGDLALPRPPLDAADLARVPRAQDGRDWMINSGVLRVDTERAGRATHAASAVLFASYPLWLWLGLRHGRR